MVLRLPGSAWLRWLRNPPLRAGVLTGIYLTAVMTVALLAANRVPQLEAFADLRNWSSSLLFLLVSLIPVAKFLTRPWWLFTSAFSGWLVFSLAYWMEGFFFLHLHSRLNKTPFHLFLLGTGCYAVVAVTLWVFGMARHAAEHGLVQHHHRNRVAHPNE